MLRFQGISVCLTALAVFCLSPAPSGFADQKAVKNTPASSQKVKEAPLKTAPSRLKNRRTLLSRHAMSFNGARYRFGAANSKATDCSGLTMQLYRKVGIKLPHSARMQYKYGKPVSKAQLLPGDLVFFNTRGGISHVGMYIGDGKMMHAANPRRGVRVDRINDGYYGKRYVGARRLLPEGAPIPETPEHIAEGNGEPPVYDTNLTLPPATTTASAGSARVAGE